MRTIALAAFVLFLAVSSVDAAKAKQQQQQSAEDSLTLPWPFSALSEPASQIWSETKKATYPIRQQVRLKVPFVGAAVASKVADVFVYGGILLTLYLLTSTTFSYIVRALESSLHKGLMHLVRPVAHAAVGTAHVTVGTIMFLGGTELVIKIAGGAAKELRIASYVVAAILALIELVDAKQSGGLVAIFNSVPSLVLASLPFTLLDRRATAYSTPMFVLSVGFAHGFISFTSLVAAFSRHLPRKQKASDNSSKEKKAN